MFEYLIQPNKVCGVEVSLQEDGSPELDLVLLEKHKNKVNVLKKVSALKNWSDIHQNTEGGDIPIAISITGKGILHKTIAKPIDESEDAFNLCMPNLNNQEFVYQAMLLDNKTIVSIARKNIIDKVIKDIANEKLNIISMNIGFQGIEKTIVFIENNNDDIISNCYLLKILNKEIQSYQNSQDSNRLVYSIADETLESNYLLAFTAAFQVLTDTNSRVFNAEFLIHNRKKYFDNKLLRVAGLSFLGISFLILLLNFFVFKWLNNRNQELSFEMYNYRKQLQQLDTLKKQSESRQSFLKQNDIFASSKVSFYADRLAEIQPNGLQLTEMSIFPIQGKSRSEKDKELKFKTNIIYIRGQSQSSLQLNQYLKSLKEIEWINDINVLPYSEKENGIASFELEVTLTK